jgi:diaminopimelate epimerase
MKLKFTKMQGAGNDFMVLKWPSSVAFPDRDWVRRRADRRLGVGFDQLLLLVDADSPGVDAGYRVFNADGAEVEQCGNGVRCLAEFLGAERGQTELKLASPSGVVEARRMHGGQVSVSLGVPSFEPSRVFLTARPEEKAYTLRVAASDVSFGAVSMGNPHVVIAADSVDRAPVGILGAAFQKHPEFPAGVNVGFMEYVNDKRIRLRVFERGVGETPACGTGAAAAVAMGRRWERLGTEVQVELPGGMLDVRWPGPGEALWLCGQTNAVYEGQIEL